MKLFNRFALWPLLLIGHLLAVGLLAWHLLAQFDFAYPLAYRALDIQQHVQEYGPLNRFKNDFELTSKQEQLAIFSKITTAVQHHGKGLTTITYHLPNGATTAFMHQAEVTHLQDVANLIDAFYTAGITGAILWVIMLAIAWRQKIKFPSVKKILIGFVVTIAVIATATFLLGPTKAFYWFHEHIFPDGHQWFFFYQDSLMTTLMKAPDLFGFIAVILLGILLLLWIVTVLGMRWLLAPDKTQ